MILTCSSEGVGQGRNSEKSAKTFWRKVSQVSQLEMGCSDLCTLFNFIYEALSSGITRFNKASTHLC